MYLFLYVSNERLFYPFSSITLFFNILWKSGSSGRIHADSVRIRTGIHKDMPLSHQVFTNFTNNRNSEIVLAAGELRNTIFSIYSTNDSSSAHCLIISLLFKLCRLGVNNHTRYFLTAFMSYNIAYLATKTRL